MSSAGKSRLLSSLAFRLSFWHAAAFTVCIAALALAFYLVIRRSIFGGVDRLVTQELSELEVVYRARGSGALSEEIDVEARELGTHRAFLRLLDRKGAAREESDPKHWSDATALPPPGHAATSASRSATTIWLPESARHVRVITYPLDDRFVLQGLHVVNTEVAQLESYALALAASVIVAGMLSGITGYRMTRAAMDRVQKVTDTAAAIAGGALDRRVQGAGHGDEIEHLAMTFNSMLDRIESLVVRIHRTIDDIAHELRTPLARLHGFAEGALSTSPDLAARTLEEVSSLLHVVNSTLDISAAESSAGALSRQPVDLGALIVDAVELLEPLAHQKGVTLGVDAEPECVLSGDRTKLQRALSNIIHNAVKYTRPNGRVTVRLSRSNGITVAVEDTGIGISREDLPNIFERFYRCDVARSEEGFGLGLSLARAIIDAHGGQVSVESTLGKGSTFTVTLPHG